MKVYIVKHYYTIDGGYGDPIPTEETIGAFSTEEKANEIVERYSDEHVYDSPYDDLICGDLCVEEIELDPEIIDITFLSFGHADVTIKEEETE